MKVLHLLATDGFGGAERVASTLHRLLLEAGHQSEIEAPPHEETLAGLKEDLGSLTALNSTQSCLPLQWAREAKTRIRGGDYDVVHLHLPSPSYLGKALHMVGRHSCVATFHLLPEKKFPGDRLLKIPSSWVLKLMTMTLPRFDSVTVAEGDKQRLSAFVGSKHLHCVTNIPPLPPLGTSPPASLSKRLTSTNVQLLCVGRLAPQKGLGRLLNALAHASVRELPWELHLLGSGPEEESLKAAVLGLGLQAKIHFEGARPAYQSFREVDLVLLPSHYEGRPLVLLEAMMAEAPLLASPIQAHREVLGEGSLALFSDDESRWPVALAAAINSVKRREKLAEVHSGRLPADPYAHLLNGYLEVYQKVML